MVLVISIPKKFKNLFSFSYSMVYWRAESSCLKFAGKCLLDVFMENEHDCRLHIVSMFSVVFV